MREADYLERQLTLFGECDWQPTESIPDGSVGKTSQEHSLRDQMNLETRYGVLTLEPCLKKSQKLLFQCLKMASGQTQGWFNATSVKSHGGSWMPAVGEYPNVERESFLSQILQEPNAVPKKYYLSSRAAAGIIRRAKERGKTLPEALRIALEMQANQQTGVPSV